jgi:hypothetical protein
MKASNGLSPFAASADRRAGEGSLSHSLMGVVQPKKNARPNEMADTKKRIGRITLLISITICRKGRRKARRGYYI